MTCDLTPDTSPNRTAAPPQPSTMMALFRLNQLLRTRSPAGYDGARHAHPALHGDRPPFKPDAPLPLPVAATPALAVAATPALAVSKASAAWYPPPDEAPDEASRLDALHRLDLLDTPASEAFDRITRLAAQLFQLPIAAVSLTDSNRQWFKSRVGVEHTSIPRERAPCALVAERSALLVIPDLLADPHFRHSHLARNGIRFYAGAPLVTDDGYGLGSLCVLGTAPRQTTAAETAALTDLAAIVMAQIELQHAMGRLDPLSGLPNRTQFIEDFADLGHDRPAGEARLAVLINLASAEQISNAVRAMGSGYLDDMIAEAAAWIRHALGPQRKLYHVSTTQFIYLAPPGADAESYCVELTDWLRHRGQLALARYVSTTTGGLVPFRIGHMGSLDLLRNAHSAAQNALEAGTLVGLYSSLHDAACRRRFTLLNAFGAALEAPGQLSLAFQPRVDLASGVCVGAEALLRWSHPTLGQVAPDEFIPVIEATALARATTAWVLRAAVGQLAAWQRAGLTLRLSVNISAGNLAEPDFAAPVLEQLAAQGVPPASLELELTESAIMAHPTLAQTTLAALAQAGIALAIDDFGTGYSSLAYLQQLRADVVKIDQSFVRGLGHDARKQALVATMLTLCHDLHYRVVAEGVERADELNVLQRLGCDEIQGYWFARPMPATAFNAWLHGYTPVARPRAVAGRQENHTAAAADTTFQRTK